MEPINLFDPGPVDKQSVDREMKQVGKIIKRGAIAGLIFGVIWTVIILAVIGGIGYVAVHFIRKCW